MLDGGDFREQSDDSDREGQSRLAGSTLYPQRNRNDDSNENSSRQRAWEDDPERGREVGRRLALYLPGEKLACHFSSFCVCVDR